MAEHSEDDLDAVRRIAAALLPFSPDDQRRILRWVQEKIGLGETTALPPRSGGDVTVVSLGSKAERPRGVRAFMDEKQPSSANQFAAAVAYYLAFEATGDERKEEISASDLQEAARLSGRRRLVNPNLTLHNASRLGYLDKGRGRGAFRINTVGENLVAMAMPGSGLKHGERPRTRVKGAPKPSSRRPRPAKTSGKSHKRRPRA